MREHGVLTALCGLCAVLGYFVKSYRCRWLDVQAKGSHWMGRAIRAENVVAQYVMEEAEEKARAARIWSNIQKRLDVKPSECRLSIDAENSPGNDSFAATELLHLLCGGDEARECE